MARDRDHDRDENHEEYGESTKKNVKPAPEESLNSYYTRKQRGTQNKFAADDDVYLWDADRDRDAEADNYKADRDAGPMNYKRWDKYGR